MAIGMDNVFGVHEAALRLRAERTQLLANNIANTDTPGFKARDIDFSAALQSAIDANGSSSTIKTTHAKHMGLGGSVGAELASDFMMYRTPQQPSLDGNTVEAHIEQAAFSRNAMEYQATLKFFEGRSKGLISAFKGE